MTDWIGWGATALFTASYFFKRASVLRRVQMLAATMWIGYGMLAHAIPVVVANLLVLGAAAVAGWTDVPTGKAEGGMRRSAEC